MKLCVVREPWRAHPLAWIHRAEAASVAAELHAAGHAVSLANLGDSTAYQPATPLLRVSDPVMLLASRSLTDAGISYLGPRAAVMERCYDKYEACRLAAAQDIDVPATALGLADAALAKRVRELAARIAALFDSAWAARVDFILESGSGRLCFLECDAAPLIGEGSAFAESFSASGVARAEQLRLLLEPAA